MLNKNYFRNLIKILRIKFLLTKKYYIFIKKKKDVIDIRFQIFRFKICKYYEMNGKPQQEFSSLIEYLDLILDKVINLSVDSIMTLNTSQELNNYQIQLKNYKYKDIDSTDPLIK